MTAKLFSSPRAVLLLAGALACTLATPATVLGQSKAPLAEVAKKEAERRKGIKDSKKVLTNKDLPESARKSKPAADSGAAGAPAAAGGEQPSAQTAEAQKPADSGQKDETYWRTRITQAREALRRNEVFAEALQSRINALTADFANRDNPIQRAQIGEDRQKALDELARLKSDIEQSRKQIDDIEEEARKAGVPPGWLR